MDGIIGGLLGYLQDPRRTQQVQGIGNALERGLLNIQQGDERFRALADRAFDPQNPGRIRDPEALKELTNMTMGLLSFAPVGMTKAVTSSKLVDTSYRGSHTAPGKDFGAPLYDLTGGGQMYPADVYSPKAVQYYGTGYPKADKEAFDLARRVKGNPDAEVTMYRAVPNKKEITDINIGDWVTLSKDYAKTHGESALLGDYKIIEKKVKAKDLYTNADSIHEFGYYPDVLK